MLQCDHCLITFPKQDAVYDTIKETQKVFCCFGCQGVFRLINNEGLEDFYARRNEWVPGPVDKHLIDTASFAAGIRTVGDEAETDLVLDGIRCASCVWLNEKILMRTSGVISAQVNYATHRARIRWNPAETGLETILKRITSIGYTPKPFMAKAYEEEQRKASRDLLIRFGTASFFSMQLMIFSIALYAGYFQGIDEKTKDLFHGISLLLTTPVLFYSGWPFLKGALRGLRHFTFNMDVLIMAGAGSAYLYSITQMFVGGEVYFDTVTMIITLILLGRYIESGAKRKASETITRLLSLAPQEARKVTPSVNGDETTVASSKRALVPVSSLVPGDRIEVIPGEKIPLDGEIIEGASEADESMLTGESRPVAKTSGAEVFAGTMNLYGSFVYKVSRTGKNTVLASIIKAVEDAQARRAPVQALVDRVVGIFVPAVLLISLATGLYWLVAGSSASLAVMNAVSVLVIACPCALGLATPLAILIGTTHGASRGILIKGGDVIEKSKHINVVVFDKTGTITEGKQMLSFYRGCGMPDDDALRLAASLERLSEHSIGRSIMTAAQSRKLSPVANFAALPGKGVRGEIDGKETLIGNRAFIESACIGTSLENTFPAEVRDAVLSAETSGATVVYLSQSGRPAGVFVVSDSIRREAAAAINLLKKSGLAIVMITGDGHKTAQSVAGAVGITTVLSRKSPIEKAEEVKRLRESGKYVIMIGDGINDAPALVEAEVGIAMGRATDIALESADMVLMRSDLRLVPEAIHLARKTFTIIKQNLFWAFFYNAVAIPLAIAGLLHPIVAAGAMALSSLTVVGNSLRARIR